MRPAATLAALALVGAGAWLASDWSGAGRRLWYPTYVALTGGRTHQDVLDEIGPRHRPRLREAWSSRGLVYPPPRVTLVALKREKRLEVWVPGESGWKVVRAYPILAASGGPGPKLREGDRQVPEGIYDLTGFNPNSSYHLSVRVDYPNADDRAVAKVEGRVNLGGDIFIHGKAVSIGCLAIGDDAIEELYVLLADVGLSRARIVLAPSASPEPEAEAPQWVADLYQRLGAELARIRGTTAAGATGADDAID